MHPGDPSAPSSSTQSSGKSAGQGQDQFSLLKAACAFIQGALRRGTGYLVTPEHVATAAHVLEGSTGPVSVRFPSGGRSAVVEKVDSESDTALLRLSAPLDGVRPLRLSTGCGRGAPWEAYGFPAIHGEAALWLTGDVQDPDGHDRLGRPALQLYSRELAAGAQLAAIQGFSGSPVLSGGAVIGHLSGVLLDDADPQHAQLGHVFAVPSSHVACLLPRDAAWGPYQPPVAAYDPRWYVPRRQEEVDALHHLDFPGSPAVLDGPELCGKTMLLEHLLERLTQEGSERTRVISVSLHFLDHEAWTSDDRFFRALALQVVEGFAGDEGWVGQAWERAQSPTERLSWLMKQHVLPAVRGRLVLAIDQADAICLHTPRESRLPDSFFGLLRAWLDYSRRKPLWRPLRLLLAISATPTYLVRNINQSPFNLSPPVKLDDFSAAQVRDLASLYGLSLADHELRDLTDLLHGHPYLLRLVFYAAALRRLPFSDLLGDHPHGTLFDDYLRHCGERLQAAGLFESARAVCDDPRAHLDQDTEFRLVRAGLIALEDNPGPAGRSFRLRYPLHRRLFRP